MPNPFDGSQLPPVYQPKKYIDPYTGMIWELDPSAYFWNFTGINVPDSARPPQASSFVPAQLMQFLLNSSPTDEGAIAIASAMSLQRSHENHNKVLVERVADAYKNWYSGKGRPVPDLTGAWAIANFMELYAFTSRGIEVPKPREVNFNV